MGLEVGQKVIITGPDENGNEKYQHGFGEIKLSNHPLTDGHHLVEVFMHANSRETFLSSCATNAYPESSLATSLDALEL